MSQSVLATHWKEATPEERQRFTEFFSQYIEETYRSKIEAYTDEEIRYGSEVIRGDRAVVDGAKAMAMTIADLWLEPGSLDSVRDAFEG